MNSTSSYTIPLATEVSLGIISVFAVMVNTVVCFIVYNNKPMRNYTNCLVVSLACSDILMAVVIFCQYLVHFNSPMLSNILYAVAMFSGVANLCAVTYDRYTAVTDPFRYLNLMDNYFRKILFYVWIGSLLIAVLPVSWGGYSKHKGHKAYIILTLVFCIFIPFAFIFFSNCSIFYHARRCSNRQQRLGMHSRHLKRIGRSTRSEFKVARIFALVAVMFMLSWFPVFFYTCAVVFNGVELVPSFLMELSPFTLALGTIVNPIIYSLMKPDFRIAVQKLCGRRVARERTRESTSLETTRTTLLRGNLKISDQTDSEVETCV